jgi:hypothetical protein
MNKISMKEISSVTLDAMELTPPSFIFQTKATKN